MLDSYSIKKKYVPQICQWMISATLWDFKNKILINILNNAALCVVKVPQRHNLHVLLSCIQCGIINYSLQDCYFPPIININGRQQRGLRLTTIQTNKKCFVSYKLYIPLLPFQLTASGNNVNDLWAKPTDSSCASSRGETREKFI